jgi:hypothetical protein
MLGMLCCRERPLADAVNSASLPGWLVAPPMTRCAVHVAACSRLEEALPDIFESLSEAYRGADGRMAQELLRRHVLKLLRIWRGWFIFSDDFVNGLQVAACSGGCRRRAGRQRRAGGCMPSSCARPAMPCCHALDVPLPLPPSFAGHLLAQRQQRAAPRQPRP